MNRRNGRRALAAASVAPAAPAALLQAESERLPRQRQALDSASPRRPDSETASKPRIGTSRGSLPGQVARAKESAFGSFTSDW